MIDENKISFQKLQSNDLSLLHKWLNEPFVKEWYGKNESSDRESIIKKYTPRIEGKEPTNCYVISYEKVPVGFIQTYKVSDYPDVAKFLKIDLDGLAGVDLFIGNLDFTGQGLGNKMLKKFLREIIFSHSGITACLIDPEENNIRAIKSYEKVGFKHLKTVQGPVKNEQKYLMIIQKDNK